MLVGAAGEDLMLAYIRDDGARSELVVHTGPGETLVIPRDRRQLLKLLHEISEALIAQERRCPIPAT